MTERYRITSIMASTTTTGKPTIELFGDTRLQFPVLRLFDASLLIQIGINPADLQPNEKMIASFYAYWEEGEKLNRHGNPYKDIVTLERIDTPATATAVDNSAILGELRAIKALLLQLTQQDASPERQYTDPPPPPDPAKGERLRTLAHAGTGDPLACPHCGSDFRHLNPECPNHATRRSTPAAPPAEEPETSSPPADPRTEFYRLGAEAMAAGAISHTDFNAIVSTANGEGYEGALAALKQKLA